MEQMLTATATRAERLDKTVAVLFAQLSRTAAQKLIDESRVCVNDAVRDASFRVNRGDVVVVRLPEAESVAALPQPERIQLDIVYEDADVVAINKPAGMVVHPAAGNQRGTLVNAVLALSPNVADVGDEDRPGIVHRLDKETSGLLLVAKTNEAYRALQAQFKARTIKKTYLALCVGQVQPSRGIINKPIARDPSHRQRMAVLVAGREAVTEYAVQEVFQGSDTRRPTPARYSLVRVMPQTGRTHQIRVHLASIGFPVVGDALYGATRHDTLSQQLAPRHLLHASEIAFDQPASGKTIKLYAPIPKDMGRVIAEMGAGAT